MLARVSERGRWALVVVVAALALVALDAWWIATFRDGYPFSIDEASYTSSALTNYFGLESAGLSAWWDAIQLQPVQAPLVPALASLVMALDPGILQGFGVLAGFLVVLAIATYGIAERLAGPRLGALAAIVVVTSPGAFDNLREFIFALPAAALLACAVYALLRSDGLQRTGWAIVCGVAIGLMLLARTMTVAFLPGLALAAGVALLLRPRRDWLPGALNLIALALAAFAVALTWYWRNFPHVYDYLTGFGYGAESADFGERHATLSWEWWHAVATRMTSDDLLLPLALVVLAGLVAIAVAAFRRVRDAGDRREALMRLLRSDAVSVAIVLVAGYLALSTSRNAGNGFTFPIAILLPPLAVIALRLHRRATVPVLALLAAITALNVAATSTISEEVSERRTVSVPGFGTVPWSNGVPKSVEAIRVQAPGPETRFVDADRAWPRIDDELGRYIVEELGTPTVTPLVAFGSRNRVINTSTLSLASMQRYGRPRIPVGQLLAEDGNYPSAYAAALRDPELGPPGVVITIRPNPLDFEPRVDQEAVEAAARRTGFRLVRTMALPNETQLRIWRRAEPATSG
jgi:Dolichyl-phosphate-mannose-protein mannosyltransferase